VKEGSEDYSDSDGNDSEDGSQEGSDGSEDESDVEDRKVRLCFYPFSCNIVDKLAKTKGRLTPRYRSKPRKRDPQGKFDPVNADTARVGVPTTAKSSANLEQIRRSRSTSSRKRRESRNPRLSSGPK
jgi:hypothetical protein